MRATSERRWEALSTSTTTTATTRYADCTQSVLGESLSHDSIDCYCCCCCYYYYYYQ